MRRNLTPRQKQLRTREIIKNTLIGVGTSALIVGIFIGAAIHNGVIVKANENETVETFVICDVTSNCLIDEGTTELIVEMPNGELHSYTVTDAPVDDVVKEVCFRTTDQDNYECYEVVALR